MKNKFLYTLFLFICLFLNIGHAQAINFDVAVIPTDLFKVCDNYFCFPETSEIMSNCLIDYLNDYGTIRAQQLSEVRKRLNQKPELKISTQNMLDKFKQTEKIDFDTLKQLSTEFNVKSIIIVSTYAISDKADVKRDLWDLLEIASAFKTSYPFSLITNVVLTDTVNNVVMWSAKYSRTVSDINGYFGAKTQAQTISQLEKIKSYYKDNVALSASQNIHLRFFPQDVRTFVINKKHETEQDKPQFVPNALDNLIKPSIIKELDEGAQNTFDSSNDFIYAF